MILDGSLSYALFGQKLFLGLKGISDMYTDDRGGYALRIIPMAEYWPVSSLSLRGGYEYSRYDQAGEPAVGSGAIGGFTVKLGKYDINANLTYRQKPVRQLPGYTIPNIKFLIGLEYHPEFLTR